MVVREALWAVLTAALAAVAFPAAAEESALALDVEVRARAIAPGEPLRILCRTPAPLVRLEGHLGDTPVSIQRVRALGEGGELWSGWAMIELLAEPGTTVLDISGRTESGREARATRALRIVDKPFATEELKVEPKYVEPPPEILARIRHEKAHLASIYALRTPMRPNEPFLRPVSGGPTSRFGTRRIFNGKPRQPHSGLDLRATVGTPVKASGDGTVVVAGDYYYSGGLVIVDHGGGLFTLYAHLSRIDVAEGEAVGRGDQVGLSGATGRVTGPHLHWGAKIGSRPFDPRALEDPRLWELP